MADSRASNLSRERLRPAEHRPATFWPSSSLPPFSRPDTRACFSNALSVLEVPHLCKVVAFRVLRDGNLLLKGVQCMCSRFERSRISPSILALKKTAFGRNSSSEKLIFDMGFTAEFLPDDILVTIACMAYSQSLFELGLQPPLQTMAPSLPLDESKALTASCSLLVSIFSTS